MSRNSWLIASENVVVHNSCYLATGTQRILMLFKVFYQGKKHVTRPIRIKLVVFFLLPQEALDDCADSIPGTLSVARCTCFTLLGFIICFGFLRLPCGFLRVWFHLGYQKLPHELLASSFLEKWLRAFSCKRPTRGNLDTWT